MLEPNDRSKRHPRRGSTCLKPSVDPLEARKLLTDIHPVTFHSEAGRSAIIFHKIPTKGHNHHITATNVSSAHAVVSPFSAESPAVISVGRIRTPRGITGLVVSYQNAEGLEGLADQSRYEVTTTSRGGHLKLLKLRKVIYNSESEVAAVFFVRNIRPRAELSLAITGVLPAGTFTKRIS